MVSDVSVMISPDGLCAYLLVSPHRVDSYPSFAQLAEVLRTHGVVFGVDVDKLRDMAANRICGSRELAARGRAAVAATPGRLEFLVDISQRGVPRLLADGRVDHREVQLFYNVEKGRALVRRIPAVAGTDGCTVSGKPIKVTPPSDVVLPAGRGTEVSPGDSDVLIASTEGALVIGNNGTIEILTEKVIGGDVDYATGNIDFCGQLRINGSVRSGFTVRSLGTARIMGCVEDAVVISESDLLISGGAAGSGKGNLYARGILRIKHIEHFTAEAGGDLTVMEGALHSTLVAGGGVFAKTIIGGTTTAAMNIEAGEVGNEAQVRTVLNIQGAAILVQEHAALQSDLTRSCRELGDLEERMFYLVKDGLDASGVLPEHEETRLGEMREVRSRMRLEIRKREERLQELETRIKSIPAPWITARKMFAGTVIRFGTYERLISREMSDIRITMDGERLIVSRTSQVQEVGSFT